MDSTVHIILWQVGRRRERFPVVLNKTCKQELYKFYGVPEGDTLWYMEIIRDGVTAHRIDTDADLYRMARYHKPSPTASEPDAEPFFQFGNWRGEDTEASVSLASKTCTSTCLYREGNLVVPFMIIGS